MKNILEACILAAYKLEHTPLKVKGLVMDNEEKIVELITRRRRQVLVHSVIYYRMDQNIISDETWARWALELEELQTQYPEIAAKCPLARAFEGFDHSTGSNLPLDDPWAVAKAKQLLKLRGYDA